MRYKAILILISFFTIYTVRAQDHIQFKNYTIKDGLSQSSVSCIVQDQLGALWLGTQDGINRFNGKDFEIFSSDRGYDISHDYIITSFIDKNENIWFGTYNGLTKYDPKMVKFYSYTLEGNQRIEIHSIKEDLDGDLWIGTSFGKIYKFETKTESFNIKDANTFESAIIDIRVNKNQLLFVSEFEGVLITDNNFNSKKIINPNLKKTENFIINGLLEDIEHDVVLSTNQGVFYLDSDRNEFLLIDGFYSKVADYNIVDARYLGKNKLVVATENAGIFLLNKDLNDNITVVQYTSDVFQKGSLISNMISGLYLDNQGIVWITSVRGLSSYNTNYLGFRGVGLSRDLSKGLPSENVWGFAGSDDGNNLFIAADHGVSNFNQKNHTFYHYNRSYQGSDDFTTLCIQVHSKDNLLVGCYDGLFELKINLQNQEEYEYTKISYPDDTHRGFDVVYTIVPYKNKNQYLIGTRAGVILYDYENNDFKFLVNNPENENTIGPGPCRFIFNYNNDYYVAPSSGGLYLIKEEDDGLIAYSDHKFSPLNSVSNSYFSDHLQYDNNTFWFGTMGDGLFKYNIDSQIVTQYNKSKGLSNNVIYGVEATKSDDKHIWLSTNKGVVAFDTRLETFYTFSEKDGLLSNELNLGASYVSNNDRVYFGGIQGYNYVNPKDAFYTNNKIKVFFSGIEVDNKSVFPEENGILSESIAFTEKIYLSYDKRSLKLRFFANDLSNPDRIEYKYILSGKDNIEEELGSSNELRFTSLSPGVYDLKIYARLTNGEWNTKPAHIIIEVERPFWRTWWFYTILVIMLILLILLRVRKNIDEGRRRQVRLEMKISERTRELRKKNKQIEQQRQQLLHQTEELEREKEKSERLLNNILPKETVSQLKKDGHSTAREFRRVSILFTDFVGFSKIAEKMPAKELVSILDTHFRAFDSIIEKNDLEKIKTIGDAYMAAGGVPIRNKTNPINTTLAAVQIKDYMLKHKEEQIRKGEPYWKLRIGINTGPVSAGVIGTKRYAYDVWGNTVNRAQRMEKLCQPEKIAITEDTFNYIEPYFECNKVGRVETKGGAKIMMYEVISIKPELSIDGLGIEPNEAFDKLVTLHHFSKINYYKAERFILGKLKKELSPKLHYHSYNHSKDVTRQAERIAIEEGITDEDLFLLKSAASYHDAGFVEQYENNERIGARMAEEILPNFGYTEAHIKRIKELIYVTEVPHQPKNKLEEIICDADLDYLGRDDFHEISDRLRRELREHGKIDSDRTWDEMQVKFFKLHKYFTETSKRTRLPKKMKHLEEIKQRLKEDKYID